MVTKFIKIAIQVASFSIILNKILLEQVFLLVNWNKMNMRFVLCFLLILFGGGFSGESFENPLKDGKEVLMET